MGAGKRSGATSKACREGTDRWRLPGPLGRCEWRRFAQQLPLAPIRSEQMRRIALRRKVIFDLWMRNPPKNRGFREAGIGTRQQRRSPRRRSSKSGNHSMLLTTRGSVVKSDQQFKFERRGRVVRPLPPAVEEPGWTERIWARGQSCPDSSGPQGEFSGPDGAPTG